MVPRSFNLFLNQWEAAFEKSEPHTPQQDKITEQGNSVQMDKVRTMMQ